MRVIKKEKHDVYGQLLELIAETKEQGGDDFYGEVELTFDEWVEFVNDAAKHDVVIQRNPEEREPYGIFHNIKVYPE